MAKGLCNTHYSQLRRAKKRAAMRIGPDHSAWQADA
jgi:hypothetical protein